MDSNDFIEKNKKIEKYLPIGSVVLSATVKRQIIIIGYNALVNNKLYDYVCTAYPEGIVNSKMLVPINHSSIFSVIEYGYKDMFFKKINDKMRKDREENEH